MCCHCLLQLVKLAAVLLLQLLQEMMQLPAVPCHHSWESLLQAYTWVSCWWW
jgi:hypothetical protein